MPIAVQTTEAEAISYCTIQGNEETEEEGRKQSNNNQGQKREPTLNTMVSRRMHIGGFPNGRTLVLVVHHDVGEWTRPGGPRLALGRHPHLTNGSLARCGGFGQPEIPHMCCPHLQMTRVHRDMIRSGPGSATTR